MAKTLFNDTPPQGTIVTAAFLNGINNQRHDGQDVDGHGPLDYAADTGSGNAYAIALTPALTAHVTGMPIWFKPGRDNTGAATIAINGMTAVNIQHRGNALAPGHLRANKPACIVYTGSVYELLTPCQPAGQIIWHPGSAAPDGALKLNGSAISRSTYAALWAWAQANTSVMSEADWTSSYWGRFSVGDGSTTFRLPDLRGEFLRGYDDSRGIDSSRVLGQWQKGSINTFDMGSGSEATRGVFALGTTLSDTGAEAQAALGYDAYDASGYPTGRLVTATATGAIALPGPGGASSYSGVTRPRNIAWLACITY